MNNAKGVYVWNLDGTLFGQYRVAKDACIAMGIPKNTPLILPIRNRAVIRGKYKVSREDVFPAQKPPRVLKKVYAYSLDGQLAREFKSIKEAGTHLECSEANIWYYIENRKIFRGDLILSWGEFYPPTKSRGYKSRVWLWTLDGKLDSVHESMSVCGISVGLGHNAIRVAIKGDLVICGKYVASLEEKPPMALLEKIRIRKELAASRKYHPRKDLPIICTAEYESVEECAKATGATEWTVRRVIRLGNTYRKDFKLVMDGGKIKKMSRQYPQPVV